MIGQHLNRRGGDHRYMHGTHVAAKGQCEPNPITATNSVKLVGLQDVAILVAACFLRDSHKVCMKQIRQRVQLDGVSTSHSCNGHSFLVYHV
jgi:hypothetical protein